MIFQWFPESLGYSSWWYLDWFDCMINFQMQRLSKLADAYFESVDGRTPPRWSSTSLSRSQTALADLDEVFDGFQRARC